MQVRHCSRAREYVDLMCSSIDLSDRPHEYGPYTLNSVLRLVLAFDSLVLALLRRTDLYFCAVAGPFDLFLRKFIQLLLALISVLGLSIAAGDPRSGPSYYWATGARVLGLALAILVLYSNVSKGRGLRSLLLNPVILFSAVPVPFSTMWKSGKGDGLASPQFVMRLLEVSSILNFVFLTVFYTLPRDPVVIFVLATMPLLTEIPAAIVAYPPVK